MAIVQPIDYTAGNGFAHGLQLRGLQDEIQQRSLAVEQAQRQADELAQFKKDWGASFGDPAKMSELVAKYPGQLETIKNAIGFQDDNHRMMLGNAARDLRVAMASNNPQAVQQAATRHAQTLATIGSSPQDVMQQLQSNPQGLAQTVDAVGLSALGAKDFYGVQNERQNQKITMRGQDLTAETARRGQDITARGQDLENARGWANIDIAQQNVNVRKLELQDKALDRKIQNETNQVQLGILQDKRAATQRELEQAKTDKVDAYNTSMDAMSRTIDTANKVLNSPGFTGYFGVNLNPLSSRHIPGTDAADTASLIDTLKSQGFMSGIQQMRGLGSLSNAEGQKIMDAIGNLSASQSEKSARESINAIISTTQLAQKRLQQKYGKDILPPAQQQAAQQPTQPKNGGFSSLWGG